MEEVYRKRDFINSIVKVKRLNIKLHILFSPLYVGMVPFADFQLPFYLVYYHQTYLLTIRK